MANQLKMAEVQAILALTRSGWSDRHIARQLGVHRETVGRHRRLSSQDSAKPASAPTGSIGSTCSVEGLANSTEGVVAHSKEGVVAHSKEGVVAHSKPASAPMAPRANR
jgi:hypothetical protein